MSSLTQSPHVILVAPGRIAETRIAETTKFKKTPVLLKFKILYRARFAENQKFLYFCEHVCYW